MCFLWGFPVFSLGHPSIAREDFLRGSAHPEPGWHRAVHHSCAEILGADEFCGEFGAEHRPEIICTCGSFSGS